MDVSQLTAAVGAAGAVAVAALLAVSPPVVAAGGLGAAAALLAGRGDTLSLTAASLALAAALAALAVGVAPAPEPATATAGLAVAAGVAGCVAAAGDDARAGPLVSAWTALSLLPVAVLVVPVVAAQPAGSLLAARVGVLGEPAVAALAPAAVAAGAGLVGLSRWDAAGFPPWLSTVGPPAALVGGVVVSPASPDFGALVAGEVAEAPVALALLWSVATLSVASALAGAVAAETARFRRGPAWVATACGPALLGALAVAGDGGSFAGAVFAVAPPLASPVGAVVETTGPVQAGRLAAFGAVAALATLATVLARAPGLGRATAGRPAGVGAGALLVAVAVAEVPPTTAVVAGGLAVLSWLLSREGPDIEPPPRTLVTRAGTVTVAAGVGAAAAAWLVGVVPRADPGVGGLLLLAGVATLGVAMAR